MKLSAAMRIGATKRPQTDGTYFECEINDGDFQVTASCALGAAYEGATGAPDSDLSDKCLAALWPELEANHQSLHHQIAAMNDSGTTREQIADWLEAQGL